MKAVTVVLKVRTVPAGNPDSGSSASNVRVSFKVQVISVLLRRSWCWEWAFRRGGRRTGAGDVHH